MRRGGSKSIDWSFVWRKLVKFTPFAGTDMKAISTSIAALLAIVPLSGLCAQEPPNLQVARQLIGEESHDKAVAELKRVVADEPDLAIAWYWLGRESFLAGKAAESVEAFDQFIALQPAAASRQWERGISCYYADAFAKGSKQFADYQTYHAADVENAAWRFLCTAKQKDIAAARKEILSIEGDRRVPMMEIYAMFKGDKTPDEVLAAAKAGDPDERSLKGRLFYAHLYVGLYEEVRGNDAAAKRYLKMAAAADDPRLPINRYMWDVARVHCLKWKEKQ